MAYYGVRADSSLTAEGLTRRFLAHFLKRRADKHGGPSRTMAVAADFLGARHLVKLDDLTVEGLKDQLKDMGLPLCAPRKAQLVNRIMVEVRRRLPAAPAAPQAFVPPAPRAPLPDPDPEWSDEDKRTIEGIMEDFKSCGIPLPYVNTRGSATYVILRLRDAFDRAGGRQRLEQQRLERERLERERSREVEQQQRNEIDKRVARLRVLGYSMEDEFLSDPTISHERKVAALEDNIEKAEKEKAEQAETAERGTIAADILAYPDAKVLEFGDDVPHAERVRLLTEALHETQQAFAVRCARLEGQIVARGCEVPDMPPETPPQQRLATLEAALAASAEQAARRRKEPEAAERAAVAAKFHAYPDAKVPEFADDVPHGECITALHKALRNAQQAFADRCAHLKRGIVALGGEVPKMPLDVSPREWLATLEAAAAAEAAEAKRKAASEAKVVAAAVAEAKAEKEKAEAAERAAVAAKIRAYPDAKVPEFAADVPHGERVRMLIEALHEAEREFLTQCGRLEGRIVALGGVVPEMPPETPPRERLAALEAAVAMPSNAYLRKMVVVGDSSVGKTAMLLRFVQGTYSEAQTSTIGAALMVKIVRVGAAAVKLEIWDTAGQEQFRSLAPSYYRSASAAVVVFDVTSRPSFDRAVSWVEELREKAARGCIIALAGNKVDLTDRRDVGAAEATALAEKHGLLFFETSAKTGERVADLFDAVASELVRDLTDRPAEPKSGGRVVLDDLDVKKKKKKCC